MKGIFEKIKIFFKESWVEAKKIDWPTRRQTLRYTLIVVGISISVAIFLSLLDAGFTKLLKEFVF
ncbi:preprotein translocase subunit SecE [bacterium]|nr:preprotein translocase subunit SecE [bacterium]